jgi:hypothetical protein
VLSKICYFSIAALHLKVTLWSPTLIQTTCQSLESSRMYCRVVKYMSTDVSEVRTATIIRELWWWRQYAPLKRRSTSTWLHGSSSQKTFNFILAAVRTWNLTMYFKFQLMTQRKHTASPLEKSKCFKEIVAVYSKNGIETYTYCYMLGFLGNMIYAPYCISIVTWQCLLHNNEFDAFP